MLLSYLPWTTMGDPSFEGLDSALDYHDQCATHYRVLANDVHS